ncbi:hypothetical protein BDN72DRAFT_794448 [Pluteus cervinus]|uniref:Uncharacterized protein n=1 Tax=Pluteus cervinus TaxID=181527 RepID=A0ACD3B1R7_9AGAR|nr:hypothetical protein BDN72DRAFT_794448 [Pluteus cervinus]
MDEEDKVNDSDLTPLEEDDTDDEYGKPSTSKSKKKDGKSGGGGYKIKNALKVPRATTYTAQSLYEQIIAGEINLEPEYQRDVVWPEAKQIGIIDSVFRNFYIPPIIFAANSLDDGGELRTCIDGKQRLTSIRRFMDGEIPHKDPYTNEKLYYTEPTTENVKKRGFKLLPDRCRRLFANKQIVCVEYQDVTERDERDIFQRVQLGMALTPAEKLQVISSPRASFIRSLLTFLRDDSDSGNFEWDRGRGNDFRCIGQTAFCIETYSPTMKNAGSITKLERWLSVSDPVDISYRTRVEKTFEMYGAMTNSTDPKIHFAFREPSKVSPIEVILIGLLIAIHGIGNGSGKRLYGSGPLLTQHQLANAIHQMRKQVREAHVDIRMNDRVARTMLDFIRDYKVTSAVGLPSVPESLSTPSAGEKRKRSRKQANGSDDDGGADDDYQPGGTRSRAKPKKAASTSALPAPLPTPTPSSSTPKYQNGLARLRATKSALAQGSSLNDSGSGVGVAGYPSPTSTTVGSPALLPPILHHLPQGHVQHPLPLPPPQPPAQPISLTSPVVPSPNLSYVYQQNQPLSQAPVPPLTPQQQQLIQLMLQQPLGGQNMDGTAILNMLANGFSQPMPPSSSQMNSFSVPYASNTPGAPNGGTMDYGANADQKR